MWAGKGSPRSSARGWESGFEPVAMKRITCCPAADKERNALRKVKQQMKGMRGPHHVTELIEALTETTADGQDEMLLFTRSAHRTAATSQGAPYLFHALLTASVAVMSCLPIVSYLQEMSQLVCFLLLYLCNAVVCNMPTSATCCDQQ